jgi:hypothetical protein
MNDTSRAIEIRMGRMIALKSPEERLRMASSMFDAAKMLAEIGLRRKYGQLNRSQLRTRMFLRFYGNDFSSAEIENVMKTIPNLQS